MYSYQPNTARSTCRRSAFFDDLKNKTGLMVSGTASDLVQGVTMHAHDELILTRACRNQGREVPTGLHAVRRRQARPTTQIQILFISHDQISLDLDYQTCVCLSICLSDCLSVFCLLLSVSITLSSLPCLCLSLTKSPSTLCCHVLMLSRDEEPTDADDCNYFAIVHVRVWFEDIWVEQNLKSREASCRKKQLLSARRALPKQASD